MEMEQPARKLRVLVIEDDMIIRNLLTRDFERRGHEVLKYVDAADAMDDLQNKKPPLDAAIVDLMNKGYGGNIGDYLRKFEEYRKIAVIYYSALSKRQFNVNILEAPNTHYVHKDPGSIQSVVQFAESVV